MLLLKVCCLVLLYQIRFSGSCFLILIFILGEINMSAKHLRNTCNLYTTQTTERKKKLLSGFQADKKATLINLGKFLISYNWRDFCDNNFCTFIFELYSGCCLCLIMLMNVVLCSLVSLWVFSALEASVSLFTLFWVRVCECVWSRLFPFLVE